MKLEDRIVSEEKLSRFWDRWNFRKQSPCVQVGGRGEDGGGREVVLGKGFLSRGSNAHLPDENVEALMGNFALKQQDAKAAVWTTVASEEGAWAAR